MKLRTIVAFYFLCAGLFELVHVFVYHTSTEKAANDYYKLVNDWRDPKIKAPNAEMLRLHAIFLAYLAFIRFAYFFAYDNFGVYFICLLTHLLEAYYFYVESFIFGKLKLDSNFLINQQQDRMFVQALVFLIQPGLLLLSLPSYLTRERKTLTKQK